MAIMNLKRPILPEIQGLRAVAVALVVLFHVWPHVLPGGYVGVDVFFVISGYLITGLLARTALREGRISLVQFYSRRARRLLPAATVVLIVSLAGSLLFLPEARWEETATQIAASALYVQNWALAWLAVDYLGAENAASPVQHYWSLSIEEQFYFVWPLVMLAALAFARRLGFQVGRVFTIALAAIFAASFAASIIITADEPARAYFVTHTRIWELALGGILALTIHRLSIGAAVRPLLAVAGFAAIVWSAFAYSPQTAFPGWAALAPTLGTVLVILAGDVRLGWWRWFEAKWLLYLGDRSYSIYLWHWPLITFYSVGSESIGPLDGIALIALTLILSHLSYQHIEQRYRHARAPIEWRPLGYGLASIAACVVASSTVQMFVAMQADAKVNLDDPRYPGPAALMSAVPSPDGVEFIPPLAQLKRDLPVVYRQKCHQDQESAEPISCTLGDPNGSKTMVITGDSHAAQWVPALERIAAAQGWKLVTLTKSACAFSRVDVIKSGKPYPSCSEWRENAIRKIKEMGTDIVFTSQSRYGNIDRNTMAEGLRSVWRELTEAGVKVIPIHDTPWMPFEPGDCLAGDQDECQAPRAEVVAGDLFDYAASAVEGVRVVDLTDAICGKETCRAVVGNVIVWRDRHHMTATYAAALAPYLAEKAGLSFSAGESSSIVQNGAKQGDVLAAILKCGPVGSDIAFSRQVEIKVEDGTLLLRQGDWQQREKRFEVWTGTVEGSDVVIEGVYRQGAGGIKKINLTGKIASGEISLRGTRGPRTCTLKGELGESAPA